MKFTYVAALLLGATLATNAQGFKDGIEYYKAGQLDNAIMLLNRNMNNSETDKALANYYLGQSYLNKGDIAKAKSYFDAGIAANPNCGYNYVGLGAIDLLNNHKKEAEDNFKKAQNYGKKNSEITIDIARAYYNADPVTYAKEIDKMVEKARKDSKNTEPAIYIFEGDRMTKERDFNKAASWYEQAINFDSDNPEGYVKYANTYFYVVPDYAIKKLEELLEKQPNSALAQRELAEKYYDNGQITRAATQYGKYMQNPNHFAQDKARYAVLLYADKKYDDAIKVSKEVLAETPGDLTLNRIIFRSLVDLERDADALTEGAKFFGNPEFAGRYNAGDYIIYAQLLTKNDKATAAENLLKEGAKTLKDDATIVRQLADVQSRLNHNADAMDSYMKYMSMVSEPSAQDYNAGSMLALSAVTEAKDNDSMRNKYAETGLKYLDEIIDPASPRASLLLRKVQILLNRNLGLVDADSEKAILELMNVLDSDPENANPANPNNSLNVYRILYNQLVSYYDKTGNKPALESAKVNLQKYTELSK